MLHQKAIELSILPPINSSLISHCRNEEFLDGIQPSTKEADAVLLIARNSSPQLAQGHAENHWKIVNSNHDIESIYMESMLFEHRYDLIIYESSLHLMDENPYFITQLYEILRPGGNIQINLVHQFESGEDSRVNFEDQQSIIKSRIDFFIAQLPKHSCIRVELSPKLPGSPNFLTGACTIQKKIEDVPLTYNCTLLSLFRGYAERNHQKIVNYKYIASRLARALEETIEKEQLLTEKIADLENHIKNALDKQILNLMTQVAQFERLGSYNLAIAKKLHTISSRYPKITNPIRKILKLLKNMRNTVRNVTSR